MRPIQTPSKLPRVGTTIFTVMSQLAAKHGAVNLGQGFPDFDCDPRLQKRLTDAMRAGHNQYAPMTGLPELREGIASKNHALYGHRHDPDAEITITAGATQALMATIVALLPAGDEAIVLEPAYDSYAPAIALAGGRPVFVPLDHAQGYGPDWDAVRAAVTNKTRLILINFPHNPTGRTLRDPDIRALERIVDQTGVVVISDEVYEHVVFDGTQHCSVMRSQTLAARSVVISSFGKTFHTTGWKVGYACAPAALSAEIRKVHQFMVFAVNTPAQYAFARHLTDPHPYLDLPQFYQAKRDLFVAGLARTPFRALACEGTYFVLADYSQISDLTEVEFATKLVVEHGVASIPVSVFYDVPVDHQVVRFCFAKKDSTLQQALARLSAL
ncbi:MAG: methionine aminotransferase [Burkholderiaceae bacterium]